MLSTKEKLEILFATMQNYLKEIGETADSFNEAAFLLKNKTLRNELFKTAVYLADFNHLPQIISDEKYQKLPAVNFKYMGFDLKPEELYRGSKIIEHHSNLLCDKNYHLGVGDVCNGLYASLNFQTALSYTRIEPIESLVLKLKIPAARVIDDISLSCDLSRIVEGYEPFNDEHRETIVNIKNFFEQLPNSAEKNLFSFLLFDDLAIVASLLGYDAIYDHNFPSLAILNREKIVVSQKEFNRICSASATHKNSVITKNLE